MLTRLDETLDLKDEHGTVILPHIKINLSLVSGPEANVAKLMKDIDADVSRLADSNQKVANAQPLLNILQLTKISWIMLPMYAVALHFLCVALLT